MKNSILKIAGVSAISFGLLGASLVGLNNTALAHVIDTNAPLALMASVPTYSTLVADAAQLTETVETNAFTAPNLRVYDKTESYVAVSAYAISIDEAAQIGAEYIWEMFGIDIDGLAVELRYNNFQPHNTLSVFHGTVLTGTDVSLNFMLDAITGERMMISRRTINTPDADVSEAWAMMQRAAGSGRCAFPVELSQEEQDVYLELARGFAQKHFNNSNVAEISFTTALASSFDRDANGNIIVTSRRLHFDATDDAGREIMVSVYQGSQELSVITTPIEMSRDGYVLVVG